MTALSVRHPALPACHPAKPRRGRKRQAEAHSGAVSVDPLDLISLNDRKSRAFIRAEAAKRDLSVSQLVRRIVETVIADRLVAAVLDDADEIARHP